MKNQLFTSFSRLWSYEKTQKSPELLKEIFSVLAYYSDDFLKERTYPSNSSIKDFILSKFGYSDFKWAYFDD